mgnify:CR=1 FL=1
MHLRFVSFLLRIRMTTEYTYSENYAEIGSTFTNCERTCVILCLLYQHVHLKKHTSREDTQKYLAFLDRSMKLGTRMQSKVTYNFR